MLLHSRVSISGSLSKEIICFWKTMKLFTNITILFLSLRRGFEPLPDPRQSLARAQHRKSQKPTIFFLLSKPGHGLDYLSAGALGKLILMINTFIIYTIELTPRGMGCETPKDFSLVQCSLLCKLVPKVSRKVLFSHFIHKTSKLTDYTSSSPVFNQAVFKMSE